MPVNSQTNYENISNLDLPENLNIQKEYIRFDPSTDKLHEGRTAFPGRDTIVTSIKNKRKFNTIKIAKEKPGYVNHYFGY